MTQKVVRWETGSVVGSYRVLRAISDGSVGAICQVEHILTGEGRLLVAATVAASSDAHAFLRRARSIEAIDSEHIARVLDAGCDEGRCIWFCVTEPIVGRTLARELEDRGPFGLPDALAVLEQLADALRAAHAAGMVHGDLRPASILVVRAPRGVAGLGIKLLDLALASAARSDTGTHARAFPASAWSPLEARDGGGPLPPQADTWGFALIAFSLLTGRSFFEVGRAERAFHGAAEPAVAGAALVSASERAEQLGTAHRFPRGFDAWFACCTHVDPWRRFPHATAAYDALAIRMPGVTPTRRPPAFSPPPGPRRLLPPAPPRAAASPIATPAPPPRVERVPPAPLATPSSWPGAAPPSVAASEVAAQSVPPPPWTEDPDSRGTRWTARGIGALAAAVALAVVFVFLVRAPSQPAGAASAEKPRAPSTPVLLRLHGSNTIGAELAPALAEAFLHHRPGARTVTRRHPAPDETIVEAHDGTAVVDAIEIAAHGSATAFEDLGAGRCDIGMSSRRIKDAEQTRLSPLGSLASAASEQVVAMDGIAVIVNPTNPASSLAKAKVAAIFAGRIRRWSELGGRDAAIVVHARDAKSGTYDTFKHLVLGGAEVMADAVRHESSEELSDAVADDPDAIGFIGLPYIRSARAVMVQEEGSVPMLPSPVTVSTEDYALSRRLYFYVPRSAPAVAREFVDFALSEEGQKTVAAVGLVDLRPACEPVAATCAACAPEYRDLVRDACRVSTDFRFDPSSAQLDTRAVRDLQRVGSMLSRSELASKSLLLLGFSDAAGSASDNLALSRRRASAVAEQLRARGLRVSVVRGFGGAMPVSDNATEEGRERNRRVEVWVR